MKELRNLIGVSFKELEELLWTAMRREFSKVLASILERLDDWLKEHLDPKRYEVKGRETRGLVSLLGDDLTIKRRRYLDKQTGAYCYGLDEALELPDRERVSPGMKSIILTQAVTTNSYRKAAESVERVVGFRAVSHETVRQVVKGVGAGVEAAIAASLEAPEGKRKVRILFAEVDSLYIPLQRGAKRHVEEKVITLHEGWTPRYPGSSEYRLVEPKQFRTVASDFWEAASRFAYSHYDIDEHTIVVLNGDRASWIRKGVDYFPNVLYQFDRWHLRRDLRRLFAKQDKVRNRLLAALDADDATGATFIAAFAEALKVLDGEKRKEAERLLKDLASMPEAIVDYRKRLEARGACVDGLRGMGAAEGQMDRFSDRMKGGRSWSVAGAAAMMEILCARHNGWFGNLLARLEAICAKHLKAPVSLKAAATEAAKSVMRGLSIGMKQGGTPICHAGRTASGGLSHLMHRINESGMTVRA